MSLDNDTLSALAASIANTAILGTDRPSQWLVFSILYHHKDVRDSLFLKVGAVNDKMLDACIIKV